jgi:hypothetical protein
MVTIGQRRLGRKIRKLENSVELSSKESKAKEAEKKFVEKTQKALGYTEDSTVLSLRYPSKRQQDSTKQ